MADKFLNQTGLSHLVTKLKTMISGKVDKEEGKGLSTNDFTDSYIDTINGLAPSVTFSKTLYVDASGGDDKNSGDSSAKFKTIEKAVKEAMKYRHCIIMLSAGTYDTSDPIDARGAVAISIRGNSTSDTIINGRFSVGRDAYVGIQNVTIQGETTTSDGSIFCWENGVVYCNTCNLKSTGGNCVQVASGGVVHLVISNLDGSPTYSMRVQGGGTLKAYNVQDTTGKTSYVMNTGSLYLNGCTGTSYTTSANGIVVVDGVQVSPKLIDVDTELSSTSENPVQNKIIKEILDDCAGKKVEGKVFTVDDQEVTAAVGAEIFNDYSLNIATGEYTHAEGANNRAIGLCAHCEGYSCIASGDYSHVEGYDNKAVGMFSHVEGCENTASGIFSHVGGYMSEGGDGSFVYGGNLVGCKSQVVFGWWNVVDENNDHIFIIGNGASEDERSNAFAIDRDGNITTKNQYTVLDSGNYSTYLNSAYKMNISSKALYVDAANGNDNNMGTVISKFKTIDKAISEGIKYESCIINLADGTYDMSSGVIDIRGSVSLSIRGTTAGSTIINGRFSVDRGACITFEKLVINAAATTSNGGIFAYENACVYASNCEISTTAGYCVNSSSNSRVFLTSTTLSGTPTQCLRTNSGGSITANSCTNTTGTYAMCSNSCSLYLNNCTDLTYSPTGYGLVCVDGITHSLYHFSRTQTLIYESTFINGLIEIDGLFTKYSSVFVTVTNFKVGNFIGSGSFVLPLQYIKSLGYYSDTHAMTTFNYGTFNGYSGTLGVNVACVSDSEMYVVNSNTTGVDTTSAGTIRIFTI